MPKVWVKDEKGFWELAIKCKLFFEDNPNCTFGDMAEGIGAHLENVCTAVTRHWKYEWKGGHHVLCVPIELVNPK